MKKLSFAILGLVILLIPLLALGCETSAPAATAPVATFVTTETLTSVQNTLQTSINSKADASITTSLQQQVTAFQNQGSANTYPKTDLYTKAEVDAIVAKLKSDQTWITGSSTGGSTGGATGGTAGQVTWVTNPSNVQTLGSQQVCYTIKITNGTAQWVYIRPIININLHTGQSPLVIALLADNVTISIGGGVGNFADNEFTVTGTTTSAILVGTKEIQLGANTTADILVCITVTGVDARIWDIMSSFNWRSL